MELTASARVHASSLEIDYLFTNRLGVTVFVNDGMPLQDVQIDFAAGSSF